MLFKFDLPQIFKTDWNLLMTVPKNKQKTQLKILVKDSLRHWGHPGYHSGLIIPQISLNFTFLTSKSEDSTNCSWVGWDWIKLRIWKTYCSITELRAQEMLPIILCLITSKYFYNHSLSLKSFIGTVLKLQCL